MDNSEVIYKICKVCNQNLEENMFKKYMRSCKKCQSKRNYNDYKDKFKVYYERDKEHRKEYQQKYEMKKIIKKLIKEKEELDNNVDNKPTETTETTEIRKRGRPRKYKLSNIVDINC